MKRTPYYCHVALGLTIKGVHWCLLKTFLLCPFYVKVWGRTYEFLRPPPDTKTLSPSVWKTGYLNPHRIFKNNQSFVYIDFCSITEGTEADSPSSSSHAMHQNNWQYPIILWSVYRRSDGPPENKSVIRKPRVWITDVMPAGHNGDKIGQGENGEKRKMGSCFPLFYIKYHIGIQAQGNDSPMTSERICGLIE